MSNCGVVLPNLEELCTTIESSLLTAKQSIETIQICLKVQSGLSSSSKWQVDLLRLKQLEFKKGIAL